jgi:acyl-CoA reductase-like NAD-dependent aldehyde dehydrogenase
MRQTPALLKKLLKDTLDEDTFEIVTSKVDEKELGHQCLYLLQNGSPTDSPKANELVSPAQSRVVAVVERDANIEEAAKALVAARFSFRGRSPYAPDVVLVNEWVKKDFLNAAVQQSIRYLTEDGMNGQANGHVNEKRPSRETADSLSSMLEQVKKEGGARIVSSGANGAILDVESRGSSLLRQKIDSSCLAVHAVSSMDDAIDLSNG